MAGHGDVRSQAFDAIGRGQHFK